MALYALETDYSPTVSILILDLPQKVIFNTLLKYEHKPNLGNFTEFSTAKQFGKLKKYRIW